MMGGYGALAVGLAMAGPAGSQNLPFPMEPGPGITRRVWP